MVLPRIILNELTIDELRYYADQLSRQNSLQEDLLFTHDQLMETYTILLRQLHVERKEKLEYQAQKNYVNKLNGEYCEQYKHILRDSAIGVCTNCCEAPEVTPVNGEEECNG